MSITAYRPKPDLVHAVEWTGDNERELIDFTHARFEVIEPEDRIEDPEASGQLFVEEHSTWELVVPGQYVIKLGDGDFRVISADRLAADYDPAAPPEVAPRA